MADEQHKQELKDKISEVSSCQPGRLRSQLLQRLASAAAAGVGLQAARCLMSGRQLLRGAAHLLPSEHEGGGRG